MKWVILMLIFPFLTGLIAGENSLLKLKVGILPTGPRNSIVDVAGVKVGHVTLIEGTDSRTGVTAILPHGGNIFQEKVPAAIYVANGFGKLAGSTQVEELGVLETPVILTNTLSVPIAAKALIEYTLRQPGNEDVRSVNPVVGETNDGRLNNIRAGYVKEEHIWQAIKNARGDTVIEGTVGAGTGTVCFGFKGGIGSSSRKLPDKLGGYTVGVLVQTNFGGILQINGAPVGEELQQYYLKNQIQPDHDGSCMMVVATDAPLNARQLKRLAKRAVYGLVRTGGFSSHGSGDYVIAFSTYKENRYPYRSDEMEHSRKVVREDALSPLFLAVVEATEEAIYHSLFAATDMTGYQGFTARRLPPDKVKKILKKYNRLIFRK